MSTYTKHIAQLSVDGDWQLDFDINITTPDKISTLVENKSIINLEVVKENEVIQAYKNIIISGFNQKEE